MQNLILDFGNTRFKAAIFEHGKVIHKFSGESLQIETLKSLKVKYPNLKKAIYSTVVDLHPELKKHLHTVFDVLELTHQTLIPIINNYGSPETLGKDRLAASVGAALLFSKKELLVIDAGSSITYERISDNTYLGGGISPGIAMRFKALNHFTDKLPLITPEEKQYNLIGKNTEESILSGVLNGVIAEVDGIIERYKEKHPDLFVLFTGGDLKHFDKNLKNNIFAAENLVLQGLNFILEYNDNKTA